VILLLTTVSICLDIIVLRQIFAFLFFTIVPGFLFLLLLGLYNDIDFVEKLVLSVVLSIAFIMIVGLLANQLFIYFGFNSPLSTMNIVVTFDLIIILMISFIYTKNNTSTKFNSHIIKNILDNKISLSIFFLFTTLSILGVHLMNTKENNFLLMLLLTFIPLSYIVFFFKPSTEKYNYPIIIFTSGLSLMLVWALRSNYIIFGADTDWEFYLYNLVIHNGYWQVYTSHILDACLSISLLPAIYYSLINLDSTFLFRIIFPLLLSICPLIIYQTIKNFLSKKYAFISTLLFISFYNFFTTNPRNNIALLFFSASFFVLFSSNIKGVASKILLITFCSCCILSHYSSSYIFFILLFISWIIMGIYSTIIEIKNRSVKNIKSHSFLNNYLSNKRNSYSNVFFTRTTITFLFIFFALLFYWYSYMIEVPFIGAVNVISRTVSELNGLFVLDSRSSVIQTATGKGVFGFPARIELLISWAIISLISLGLIYTVLRSTGFKKLPKLSYGEDLVSFNKIGKSFLVYSIVSYSLVIFPIVFPYTGRIYDITRIYFQMLIFFIPFFFIGFFVLWNVIQKLYQKISLKYLISINNIYSVYLKRIFPSSILVLVLVLYFMSTTGVTYEIYKTPKSLMTSSNCNQYDDLFIHDQESFAAKWMGNHVYRKGLHINTDYLGRFRVIIEGNIEPYFSVVDNSLYCNQSINLENFVFLRYYNIVDNKVFEKNGDRLDLFDCKNKFENKAKIYCNGGSEIWR